MLFVCGVLWKPPYQCTLRYYRHRGGCAFLMVLQKDAFALEPEDTIPALAGLQAPGISQVVAGKVVSHRRKLSCLEATRDRVLWEQMKGLKSVGTRGASEPGLHRAWDSAGTWRQPCFEQMIQLKWHPETLAHLLQCYCPCSYAALTSFQLCIEGPVF